MRTDPRRRSGALLRNGAALAAAGLAALLAGCAGTGAPSGVLPPVGTMDTNPYGAWIRIESGLPGREEFAGELIAAGTDSVFVADDSQLAGFAAADVESAELAFYDPGHGPGNWAAAGALTTLSHGVLLVFSLPTWCVFGPLSNSANVSRAEASYPDQRLDELRMFARFPRGLPDGVDRAGLRSGYGKVTPERRRSRDHSRINGIGP